MEQYLIHLPYFLFFVFLGIVVNFLNKTTKLTAIRVGREFIGAIWVSLILFAVLNEFFDLSYFIIYIFCSVAGYGNSKIIDFLHKDFFEFIIEQGKQFVENLVNRVNKPSLEDEYDTPEIPEEMERDTEELEIPNDDENRQR